MESGEIKAFVKRRNQLVHDLGEIVADLVESDLRCHCDFRCTTDAVVEQGASPSTLMRNRLLRPVKRHSMAPASTFSNVSANLAAKSIPFADTPDWQGDVDGSPRL
jgi:hypothetical protein